MPPRMSELLADRRIINSMAMLWEASAINGYAVEASDGRLGAVTDLLFEDVGWVVRWLVVDTGNWLPDRRKVLLPLSALGQTRLGVAPLPNQTDHAASQGQPRCRHGFACVTEDRSAGPWLFRVGSVLERQLPAMSNAIGRRHSRRSLPRMTWLAPMLKPMRVTASPQHGGYHRVPYPRQRR